MVILYNFQIVSHVNKLLVREAVKVLGVSKIAFWPFQRAWRNSGTCFQV